MSSNGKRALKAIKESLPGALKMSIWLVKITVSISLVILFLRYTGILYWVSNQLSPVFKVVGLPGEAALVFVTGYFVNVYSAIAVIATLSLDVRAITILGVMVLCAHNIITETAVQKKTGSSAVRIVMIRTLSAFILGVALNLIMPGAVMHITTSVTTHDEGMKELFVQWFWSTLSVAVKMVALIYALSIMQRLLSEFGVIRLIAKFLKPIMLFFGLPAKSAFLWIVANTLGLAYGAAVMIEETELGKISKQDANLLNHHISISHSNLEDVMLMVSVGAMAWWLLLSRWLMSFLLAWELRLEGWIRGRCLKVRYTGQTRKSALTIVILCSAFGSLDAQEATMLPQVVVRPGVNPAHRIIENAINHRNINNPEKRFAYMCVQYNRMTLHVVEDSTSRQGLSRMNHPLLQKDTSSYNLIMESVLERTFVPPETLNEKVIASKTSGFKEYQQLSMVPSALQFFHFYDDRIEWKSLNLSYLNPISPNSTDKYFFLLRDTTISSRGDSTFVISFQPSRLSNIDGLKGMLYINSNRWAIEKVIAEPATATLFPIKIEQQYRLIDSTIWFPSELSFEMCYHNFALTGLNMIYYSKSSISNVMINPNTDGIKMGAKTMIITPDAGKHPEYIERYRTIPLSQKEINTYQKYEESNYDWAMQIAEGAVDNNSLSIKSVDIPFNQVINYNYFEGFRLGMGLYTNRRLAPWFSVGGYCRYGLKDKKMKYGASFSLFPNKDRDTEIKVWYHNDMAGLSYSHEAGVLGNGLMGNFRVGLQYKVQEFSPFFDYTFRDLLYDYNNRLHNSEIELIVRYSIHERRTKVFKRTHSVQADYPILSLKYAVGIPGVWKGEYFYQKVELGIEFDRFIRNFGRTFFCARGGIVSKDIPVMMLFNQSYLYRTIFLSAMSKYRFNAIVNQIYASNRYVNGFLYHDFGSLLYKTKSKIFAPRIALAQSAGWSWLSNPEEHGGEPLCDMHRGYFESGIVVEDLIRFNYLNLFYFGLGGALYGAYGGSVTTPFKETLTPMIRLSISF